MADALDAVLFCALWLVALLITIGFGGLALAFAFYAGAAWKAPPADEPDRWKWRLGVAISVGVILVLSQRYDEPGAAFWALIVLAGLGFAGAVLWKARQLKDPDHHAE